MKITKEIKMSAAFDKVIADLEKKLQQEIDEAAWIHKRFKDAEKIILNLRETLNELKEVQSKL